MLNKDMSMILDELNESRINEAQKIHVVRYLTKDIKDGQGIFYSEEYNKIKKLPGYKELDHAEIDKSNVKLHSNYIRDYIEKYGKDLNNFSPDSNGHTLGHYGEVGYGYQLYNSSKQKPYGYPFNLPEYNN